MIKLVDGTRMPGFGLGTYKLLGTECTRAVARALELGYRHIDTALIYENQRAIAKGMQGFDRSKLYLTSKLWFDDYPKDRVEAGVDRILDELQIDHIDQLLIHWPDRTIPIEETIEAMGRVQSKGKVISIGVSNFMPRHLEKALSVGVPIVTNQVEVHPFFTQEPLRAYCKERGVVIVAYAPVARGAIQDDRVLQRIGRDHGKTAAQIALRWSIQREMIPIPKTAHLNRVEENFAVFDFVLSREELAAIDELDRGKRTVCPSYADFDEPT